LRIKQLRLTPNEQTAVYKALLKDYTDEELHEMSEEEIVKLILQLLGKLRNKKMKKDARLIYV